MAARDDYPLGRHTLDGSVIYTMDPATWKDMCDEVNSFRAQRPHPHEPTITGLPLSKCAVCGDGLFAGIHRQPEEGWPKP